MKVKLQIAKQVSDFVKSLPPDPRHKIRLALKRLEKEQGDIKPLRERLEGYFRLRIGSYRIIFAVTITNHNKRIDCLFAERRKLIYEVFSDMLSE